MKLILEIPMPPTSNNIYVPVGGRLIKSREARNYEDLIVRTRLKYCRKIDEFKRESIVDFFKEKSEFNNELFQVDTYFIFPKKKFFTKDNTLRKFDHWNRQKQVYDSVAKLIDYDDSLFIAGDSEKCWHNKDYETVFVVITRILKSQDFDEIKHIIIGS